MTKMQQIWDAGHPVKAGDVIPEGTEYATAMSKDGVVSHIGLGFNYGEHVVLKNEVKYIRTVEPLPDQNDTGLFRVEGNTASVLVHLGDEGYITLTKEQARNFVRKITEALDA